MSPRKYSRKVVLKRYVVHARVGANRLKDEDPLRLLLPCSAHLEFLQRSSRQIVVTTTICFVGYCRLRENPRVVDFEEAEAAAELGVPCDK